MGQATTQGEFKGQGPYVHVHTVIYVDTNCSGAIRCTTPTHTLYTLLLADTSWVNGESELQLSFKKIVCVLTVIE